MSTINIYSDVKNSMPYKKPLAVNLESIQQALSTLLSVNKGERLFLPEYGCDLEETLFEFIDNVTEVQIFQRIVSALELWEPRVTLDYANTIISSDPDNNSYDITLVFTVKGLEDKKFSFSGTLSNQ